MMVLLFKMYTLWLLNHKKSHYKNYLKLLNTLGIFQYNEFLFFLTFKNNI